jgi:putative transposase
MTVTLWYIVVMTIIQKSYKFRVYPNQAQRQQLAIEFGNARFVWNKCLDLRSKAWEERQERHSYISLNRLVTQWKKAEFPWLAESAACCLTQALIDQDKAFKNFFEKRGRYPKFKSRYHRQAVRYQLDQRQIKSTSCAGEFLKLPKLGFIQVRWSQVPLETPKMATVSKAPCGRYFVAFACEIEAQAAPTTNNIIGLDLGIKDVVVGSDGYKSGNPQYLRIMQRRLKHQQRALARKRKGSNRRRRQKINVAKLHARVAAMRANFLHETTTAIIRRADVIAMEDLNVRGMMKNPHLAGAIGDVGMREFRRQIEYKAAWNGRQVIIADRWAPTSKVCSECGSYLETMPLKIRTWTCPDCGTEHDRDINAARNVLMFATAGDAGRDARGGGKTLSSVLGTLGEARTEAMCEGGNHGG